MRIEWWPIDKPADYPKNARKWSAKAVEKVAMSIREYGWRQPVVVDSQGVIVIGHLRRAAGKSIGETQCPVHVADNLTPAQIRGLRLADNRTAQEAEFDFDLLKIEFEELKALDFDLKLTAFDMSEIDAMKDGPLDAGAAARTLAERFGVPPFSVLDARQGYWQERKRAWLALAIQPALGRGAP